jgi:F0F1-type ATP synthase membrane subunit a
MLYYSNINSPLDQFEIRDILNLDFLNLHLSITNIGLYLTIGTLIIIAFGILATNYNKLVSNN